MQRIGSQNRETLAESGMELVCKGKGYVHLRYPGTDSVETWVLNDHFAGYVIEVGGRGYEFVRSELPPR